MPFGFARRRSRQPPSLIVDEPVHPVEVAGGTVLVRGWAIDGSHRDPGTVVVVVDGHRFPVRRLPRADVARSLELDSPELAVGYSAAIDRRNLPTEATIVVHAEFAGHAITSAPVPFTNVLPDPVPTEPIAVCPICASPDRTMLGSSDGLRMARCRRCTAVYTVDRPTPDFMAARYSKAYFETEYLPALDAEPDQMAAHWDRLLDEIEPYRHPEASMFEIGSGAGQFLVAARRRGWRVSGIDINQAAVDHGRDHYDLDLHCAPADADIEPAGPFDAVVSEMSLEHLADPAAAVERARAALRPGGVLLVFTVCADGQSFSTLGMASPLVGPAEHLFLFSAQSLTMLAERAGLEPLRHWTDDAGDAIGLIARRPR